MSRHDVLDRPVTASAASISERQPHAEPGPPAATVGAPDTALDTLVRSPSLLPALSSAPGTDDRGDDYDHLEPMLRRYAALSVSDPARARLREQLVCAYLPVAQHIAQRYAQRGEPVEDLTQVGYLALINAIDRYQPGVGHHFLGFAVPTITGEIRRHFRDKTWVIRVPRRIQELRQAVATTADQLAGELCRAPRPSEIAQRLDISTDEVLETLQAAQAYRPESLDELVRPESDPEGKGVKGEFLGHSDDRFEVFTNALAVAPHLAALPERERHILYLRFYEDMTQSEIARRLGLSQMHISRLLSQTLTKLRDTVDQPASEETSQDATCSDHGPGQGKG